MISLQEQTKDVVPDLVEQLTATPAPDWNQLVDVLYDRLKVIASSVAGPTGGDRTMGATALVNAAYIKLVSSQSLTTVSSVEHFLSLFATVMRQELLDYHRSKKRISRGGHYRRVELDFILKTFESNDCHFEDLDEAIDLLAIDFPRQARVLNMKVFVAMSVREIAKVLSLSISTIESDLRLAKAYIARKMEI